MMILPSPYYQDAAVTIYHGDCQEILPALPVNEFDLLLTDPPFSVPVRYHDASGSHPRSWGDLLVMESFFRSVFKQVRRTLKDTSQSYICCDHESMPVFFKCAYDLWTDSQLLVWYKPTGRRGRGWMHSHELILHFRTSATEYRAGFRQDLIGIMPVRTLNRMHPAEKPGALWSFLLEASPRPAPSILDPFGGSGSQIPIVRRLGGTLTLIESEEWCCERAAERCRQEVLDLTPAPSPL